MKSRNKIAGKLLIYILLFSSIVTIFIAAIQLYTEYKRDLDNIDDQFTKIEEIFKPALSQSLWFFNEESIKVQLEGISHLSDIEYIELIDKENNSTIVGEKQSKHSSTRHILLIYNSKGKEIEVGTLTVVASRAKVYKRLFERLIIVLLSQGLIIFLVSIFIFLLVHFLVIKHVRVIDDYLKNIGLSKTSPLLELQRKSSPQGDELDQMVASINEMTKTLHGTYEKIEQTVKERTADLKNTNEQLKNEITKRKQAEETIKASLKEKEVLLREIHHRVKNNMQVIIGLLKLQSDSVKDRAVMDALMNSQMRIQSMSAVHETLYSTESLSFIDFETYTSKLARTIFQSYGANSGQVELKIEAEDIKFGIDQATPLGLLINELVSNALKHAFPDNRPGEIAIKLKKTDEDEIELVVGDNGIGLPENFDWRNTDTLGFKLVNILAEGQLDGEINLERDDGARFIIRFKLENNH